ncbi:baculoviral IAP repeat-containing protein 5-like [Sipha flava]|uniref:Baculoviral IAP repeat-containing protein 5-like n=1 Tax=Sipha flava TaxID=143950 RepID=A0A8B8FP45_9HEMI|nr:baculoviral IAP repeat-containing protein 5-like [Sipha flava]
MQDIKQEIMKNVVNQMGSFEFEPTIGYVWELSRLKSLENWTMEKPSAEEMAEAGFYCPNPDVPDVVKCFSCFIELDGWEPTDKPWNEHRKRALTLNPPCKFIEIGKKEMDCSVNDFLEIQKSVALRSFKEKCEKNLKTMLALHKKQKSSLKKELQKLGVS